MGPAPTILQGAELEDQNLNSHCHKNVKPFIWKRRSWLTRWNWIQTEIKCCGGMDRWPKHPISWTQTSRHGRQRSAQSIHKVTGMIDSYKDTRMKNLWKCENTKKNKIGKPGIKLQLGQWNLWHKRGTVLMSGHPIQLLGSSEMSQLLIPLATCSDGLKWKAIPLPWRHLHKSFAHF
jgi:hypothetical protein